MYYDYKSMKYKDMDQQFINSIEARMREIGDIDDEELKAAFCNYT